MLRSTLNYDFEMVIEQYQLLRNGHKMEINKACNGYRNLPLHVINFDGTASQEDLAKRRSGDSGNYIYSRIAMSQGTGYFIYARV